MLFDGFRSHFFSSSPLDNGMSCPMFAYGFAAGSIIPLAIVYLMRPESLTNLLEFFSTSLFMALNWSDGVAERFNLTTDLFSSPVRLSMKIYSCYHIEYWYQTCSWVIYLSLFSSLILFLLNQHLKSSEFFSHDDQQGRRDVGRGYCFLLFLYISSCDADDCPATVHRAISSRTIQTLDDDLFVVVHCFVRSCLVVE